MYFKEFYRIKEYCGRNPEGLELLTKDTLDGTVLKGKEEEIHDRDGRICSSYAGALRI